MGRGKHKTEDVKRYDLMNVAFLLGHLQMSQAEIQSLLKVSQPEVSRLTQRAIEEGLISPPMWQCESRMENEIKLIRDRIRLDYLEPKPHILLARLQRLGASNLRRVHIYHSSLSSSKPDERPAGSGQTDHKGDPKTRKQKSARVEQDPMENYAWDNATIRFGKDVAEVFQDLLFKCRAIDRPHCVGIAWGRTIFSLCKGMESLSPPLIKSGFAITMVPLWGSSLGTNFEPTDSQIFGRLTELDATQLAIRFDRIVNGPGTERKNTYGWPPNLGRVPGLLPVDLPDKKSFIRNLSRLSEIDRVFGEDGLIHKMSMAIISCGSPNQNQRFWSNEFLVAANASCDEMKNLVVGDVGGVLLEKENLTETQLERINAIKGAWMGVTESHLRKLAEEAIANGLPGVVLLSIGERRSQIAFEAVARRNLVNELVIDHVLAKGIDMLAAAEEKKRA